MVVIVYHSLVWSMPALTRALPFNAIDWSCSHWQSLRVHHSSSCTLTALLNGWGDLGSKDAVLHWFTALAVLPRLRGMQINGGAGLGDELFHYWGTFPFWCIYSIMHLDPQLLPLKRSRGAALGIKKIFKTPICSLNTLRVIIALFPSDGVSTKAQTLEKQFWQIPCSLTRVHWVYLGWILCTHSPVGYCLGYTCLNLAGHCQGWALNPPAQVPAILQQESPETHQGPDCSEQFQPALGQNALSRCVQWQELASSRFMAVSPWHRHQAGVWWLRVTKAALSALIWEQIQALFPSGITKQSYILEA